MARNVWFKHWNEASWGDTLRAYLDEEDYESYALWWILCETMSRLNREPIYAPGKMKIPLSSLASDMNMKPARMLRCLDRFFSVPSSWRCKIFVAKWEQNGSNPPVLLPECAGNAKILLQQNGRIPSAFLEFCNDKWPEFQERRGQKSDKKNGKKAVDDRGQMKEERGQMIEGVPEGSAEQGDLADLDFSFSAEGPPQPPLKNKRSAEKKPAKSGAVWEAYTRAYWLRYRVDVADNKKIRSQMCQLVDLIGAEAAPEVAAFFVRHNGGHYVARGHDFGLCLLDAQKLRMEWMTGRQVTRTEAQTSDRRQANANALLSLMEGE